MGLNALKLVFLDAYTTNPGDLDWGMLKKHGDLICYDRTSSSEIEERARTADILIVNKVPISSNIMDSLPNLQCICVAATGFDKVDIHAAGERNIPVFNVRDYSRDAVAERVFSFLFHHTQQLDNYFEAFRNDKWSGQEDFSYWLSPIHELKGKTLGIIGMGSIGSRVNDIARSLGMNVIYTANSRKGEDAPGRRFVSQDELLKNADFISLHLPLSDKTENLVDRNFLFSMKPTAILINTSRGGLIDENALAEALKDEKIYAAYLDVLREEPPAPGHIFTSLKNCFVSPHTAWASQEARLQLIRGISENIRQFSAGNWSTAVNVEPLNYAGNS